LKGEIGERTRAFVGDFHYLNLRLDGSRLEGIEFGDFNNDWTLDLKYSDGEIWSSVDRR